jgi:hypothetical protein
VAVTHDGALLVSDDAKARSFGLPAGLLLSHALTESHPASRIFTYSPTRMAAG